MRIKTSKGELPIRYSFNTLRKIGDDLDMSMNEMLSFDLMNRKMSDVFTFVLHGFIEGAKHEGEDCKVSNLDEIGELLDSDPQVLAKAMERLGEDMLAVNKGEEEVKKK
jgi:hypothetical protein